MEPDISQLRKYVCVCVCVCVHLNEHVQSDVSRGVITKTSLQL